MKRKILPYNSNLKPLAGKLRQNLTFSEVKLWNKLKLGQMMHYDFDRQRPIANYIVDFYCKDLCLAIEVDGMSHDDTSKDDIRQKELEVLGVKFLRFGALAVVHDIDNVVRAIEHWINEYEENYGVPGRILKKRKG